MKKSLYRIASIALAAVFLAAQNPILAQGLADSLTHATSFNAAAELEILGEVPEKRSEFTKHFRMSDGSMKAVTYADQVHYKSGDEFKEIDNSLIDDENDSYKNTDSPFKVKFAKQFKNKNLVTVNADGHEISWSYIKKKYKEQIKSKTQEEAADASEKTKEIQSAEALLGSKLKAIPTEEANAKEATIENLKDSKIQFANKNEEKANINKICAKAKYAQSDDDIDLDYVMSGLKLKENIILNKKSSDNESFDFEFKTDLTVSKDNSGNLIFSDSTGKAIYTMPKGSMWDTAKGFSSDISYEFSKTDDGYLISIIPSQDWLSSDDRVYPITIDPSITEAVATSAIKDTYTQSNLPSTVYEGTEKISVGKELDGQEFKSYIKATALPKFNHGEIVTNAKLSLWMYNYVTTAANRVSVKKINSSWNASTLTAGTAPEVDSTVQDYAVISTNNSWYSWDITRLAKEWYTLPAPNENNGLELSTQIYNVNGYGQYVSTENTSLPEYRPKIEISYKEFVGEEDYWSYTSHSAGLRGSGQVNNYAGTLSVSENILSYSGTRNPLSLFNTYNNVNYNEHANSYIHTQTFTGGYSHSSSTGLGFRLSFNQLIYPISQTDSLYSLGWRYVHVDGDGTQHYFKVDGTVFTDEDGLGFTITNNSGVLELTDLKDNKLTFEKLVGTDVNYVLTSSSDNNNNNNTTHYYYEYQPGTSGSKVSRIKDAADRETYITYGPNGIVTSVIDSDNKTVAFTYDGEKLTEITYPDGLKTGYVYDLQGRLSGVWTNEGTGSSVGYQYASNDFQSSNFFKIRSVTEYGSQNFDPKTAGNSVNFYYEMNQTKITNKTSNLDVPYHESAEIWQFDNEGRVTAVMDENGNMVSNAYETATDGRKNKVKHSNDCGKYTNNLLKNSAAINGTDSWKEDNWLAGTTSSVSLITTATETEASLGQNCFKVSRAATDSAWPIARQRVSIPSSSQDKKYTFSGDIKTTSALSDGSGASLHIASFDGNNQQLSGDGYSEWITDTNGDWRRVNVTITAPAGAKEIECCFGIKESVGTAYFDCLQLEESDTANDYNMIENSSFDSGLDSWTTSQNFESTDGVVDGQLKLVGNPTLNKNVYQTIPINKTNPVLAIRATSQGQAIPNPEVTATNPKPTPKYYLSCEMTFEKTDEYGVALDPAQTQEHVSYVPFNSNISDMQSIYGSIYTNVIARKIEKEFEEQNSGQKLYLGKLISVNIKLGFDQNCNTVYFDNVQAYIDDHGISYERNEKGSIIKSVGSTGNTTTFTRDATSDEITKVVDPRSNESDFEYNALKPHELANSTVQTPGGNVKSGFTHDSYGNVTASQTQDAPAQGKAITSSSAYTSNKAYNYPESTTDSRGKTTTFDYNQNSGNLNSVMDPKGVTTNFAYDTVGRLLTATCAGSQNDWSYTNGILSSLSHKIADGVNVAYNFVRDTFGNITSTKVGDQTLSTSTYDAGNGLLRQVKYANNQCTNYDYDNLGRLSKKYYAYGKSKKNGEFTYAYDNKNRLVETYDPENNLTTKFDYDKYGRLSFVRRSDGTTSDVKYNSYIENLVDKTTSQLFGITQTIANTFGVGNMLANSKITVDGTSIWSKYNYDALGRTGSTETLNEDETLGVKHNFSHLDVGTTGTTGLVSSVEFMKKDSGNWTSLNKKFSYNYDDVGNITDIKDKNSNLIVNYEYDNLNQLIRENNVNLNKTIAYSYDLGGNIQSKKIYAYTTATDLSVLTPENTVVYGYSDSNWKDKMTSYGDDEIIYDAIGNPLVYRNGMQFEWSHGRRLDKTSNQSYNVTYKYDDGGIRTSKTVNGTTTNFITSGIQVLAQKTGDNILVWQVDGNGSTVGFNYNGTQYFYLKNAQSDVAAITDASGNIVAEYVYDSWGKVLHVLDANGAEITDSANIALINPLRYRGYYYDSELGLYYLNARYYDPETGRFINADDNLEGGLNLFAYCANNPVMLSDRTGNNPYQDMIKTIMDMAKEIRDASFGKTGEGEQCEYATLGYEVKKAGWKFFTPWTDGSPVQVRPFSELQLNEILPLVSAGNVTRVIGIHGHQVFPIMKDGKKVWHYDQDFSDIVSTGGKSGGDMAANMKAFALFKRMGIKYYAIVVLADGRIRLHDPETGYKDTIGMTDPDPNMKYSGTGTQQKSCVIM